MAIDNSISEAVSTAVGDLVPPLKTDKKTWEVRAGMGR